MFQKGDLKVLMHSLVVHPCAYWGANAKGF